MQDDVVPLDYSKWSQEERIELGAGVRAYLKRQAEVTALEKEFEALAPEAARAVTAYDRDRWHSDHRASCELTRLREMVGLAKRSAQVTPIGALVAELQAVCPPRTMEHLRRGIEVEKSIAGATPISLADAAAVAAATCRGPLGNLECPAEPAWTLMFEAVYGVARCLEACTGTCWPSWSPPTISRPSGIITSLAGELSQRWEALNEGQKLLDGERREKALDRLYREGVAIERALLTLPPCTIADCAIVLGVAATLFDELPVSDEQKDDQATTRRAIASIFDVLHSAGGLGTWSPSGTSMIIADRAWQLEVAKR